VLAEVRETNFVLSCHLSSEIKMVADHMPTGDEKWFKAPFVAKPAA
jgi:hypothetical protein